MSQWTESLGRCTPFTYTVAQSNGLAIPSLLTFNADTRQFTVDTNAIATTETYEIKVTATLNMTHAVESITFSLVLKNCENTVISTQAIAAKTLKYMQVANTFAFT